ncbi:hypothetical protein [Pseudoalteromonas simplex]|uniref:hypothetical protein n=1 Tax=Pseudoalteromonas simplex TaxID=2783613 RepID=UPI001886CC36|nr:hypothetical protein [Pseudoalteromonas sp. A520]
MKWLALALCVLFSAAVIMHVQSKHIALVPAEKALLPVEVEKKDVRNQQAMTSMHVKPTLIASETIDEAVTNAAITTPDYFPPIAKQPQQTKRFTGDLNDHKAYQAYHQTQQTELELRFIDAAESKIATLESLLERGKQAELSEDKLNEAEDKIAALKTMQAELVAKHNEKSRLK